MFLSQDPVHKWADLQRALLSEGQSVWCCKDCIGIIKEDTNATYEEIRIKVEAAAAARLEPLPEITGDATSVTPAGESAGASQAAVAKVEARAVAAEERAKVAEAEMAAAKAKKSRDTSCQKCLIS